MITLRPARYDDAVFFYALWSDPSAREFSPSKDETPCWQTHLDWYVRAMNTSSIELWVAERPDGEPVATFRVEWKGEWISDRSYVSLIVAPAWRDRDVGTEILREKARRGLWAQIHHHNRVSIRLFEHAGFHWREDAGDYGHYERV